MMLTIRTGPLVVLSVSAGLFLGVLIGRHWDLAVARAMARGWWAEQRAAVAMVDPRRDTAQSRADSLRALRRTQFARPRELARVQALQHCIVTLSFPQDWTEMRLMHVQAFANGPAELGRGWMYRPEGYPRGARVSVVIPYTRCHDIRDLAVGGTRIDLPWLERPDSAWTEVSGNTAGLRGDSWRWGG